MRRSIRVVVALIFLLAPGQVMADSADQTAVAKVLHGMFDKPDAPLKIAPVVMAGDHAIAGWTQGDMGGRALLRRKHHAWEVILCAGDGIKSRDALTKAGIPAGDAAALERDLAAAEGKLDPQHVAMFSRFEGVMMMDQGGHHPPALHPRQGTH